MLYYVTYGVDAEYTAVIEASDFDEALMKAENNFHKADFGVARVIKSCIKSIENKNETDEREVKNHKEDHAKDTASEKHCFTSVETCELPW